VKGIDRATREELASMVTELQRTVATLSARVAELEEENEALRSGQGGVGKGKALPPFVKANRKERRDAERQERKKRKKSYGRRRETPTEEIEHYVETCPDCGHKLTGGWEHGRHQVMEIPKAPLRVIDHILMARRCGYCGKTHIPKLTVEDGVIGKQRVGIRLMSLIATLSTESRIPQRIIQKLLSGLYGLHISLGEISEILHKVADYGAREVEEILEEVRGSPIANGDETGWRESGMNGYLWSFSTPNVRYFQRDASRGGKVAREILSEKFDGVLVCDFYSGYNWYEGPKQRCWVHYIRDLKALAEEHASDRSVVRWVDSIISVYKAGKKVSKREYTEGERHRIAGMLEERLFGIAQPYLNQKDAPQHKLAKRVKQFGGEMFTFVRYPGVPSGNNAAERAIRPAVIVRKVSGGTRSDKGSKTKSILLTLFGTWSLRKLDTLDACINMLIASQSPA
jgi:transposase